MCVDLPSELYFSSQLLNFTQSKSSRVTSAHTLDTGSSQLAIYHESARSTILQSRDDVWYEHLARLRQDLAYNVLTLREQAVLVTIVTLLSSLIRDACTKSVCSNFVSFAWLKLPTDMKNRICLQSHYGRKYSFCGCERQELRSCTLAKESPGIQSQ